METQMNVALGAGSIVFAVGLVAAIVSLVLLLSSPGKRHAASRLWAAIGLGIGGFLVGAWLGVEYFCSPGDAGNLCGLGGVLGSGPLLAGLGLLGGARLMLKARVP